MSSLLWSIKTSAQQPNPTDFSCLNRDQKSKIADCFEKKDEYEQIIDNQSIVKTMFGYDWKILLWTGAVGIITGMALEHEIAK
jgi:hypothetical protein